MLDDFLEKFRLDDLPDFRQIIYLSDDMINIEFEYIKECFILDKILNGFYISLTPKLYAF